MSLTCVNSFISDFVTQCQALELVEILDIYEFWNKTATLKWFIPPGIVFSISITLFVHANVLVCKFCVFSYVFGVTIVNLAQLFLLINVGNFINLTS